MTRRGSCRGHRAGRRRCWWSRRGGCCRQSERPQRGCLSTVALELGLEGLDAVVVGQDVEQVVVSEVIEHELKRGAGLLDLLAGHRARAIEHEDDRLGLGLLFLASSTRGLARSRK